MIGISSTMEGGRIVNITKCAGLERLCTALRRVVDQRPHCILEHQAGHEEARSNFVFDPRQELQYWHGSAEPASTRLCRTCRHGFKGSISASLTLGRVICTKVRHVALVNCTVG